MSQTAIQQPAAQSTVLTTVKKWLEQQKDGFASMLPEHMSTDRFFKIALNCISKTPRLQQCSPHSLFQAITTAAELGLDPGGALGDAYLVPYKKDGGYQAQLIVGYRGFIRLARQSGELASIEAHIVHEHDRFRVQYGLDPKLEHEPTLTRAPGKPLLAYCLAKFKDGGSHFEVMTVDEIEKIRARSRSKDDGPWTQDWSEMAKKTVVRRTAKYLPLSSERWQSAQETDNSDFIDGDVIDSAKATLVDEAPAKGNEKAKRALSEKKMKMIEATASETVDEAIARENQALPIGDENAEPPNP